MAAIVNLPHIYNVSVNKFRNFHESEGLRKFAMINNFIYTKFEAEQEPPELSEERVKKDEESWLEACLDSLDEEENGYVYITLTTEEDDMELEEQDSNIQITEDIIIPDDLLHSSYFVSNVNRMAIDKEEEVEPKRDEDVNMVDDIEFFDTSSEAERSFHPYWKDNSIIDPPPSSDFYRPFFNFDGVPRSFQKYHLGRDDVIVKPLDSNAVLGLLDHRYHSPSHPPTDRRSKDDLDILYSLTPRDLDRDALMDVIRMLEFQGEKKNDNSEKNFSPSSLEDDKIWFIH
ncbi:13746_t:CDS:1 [Acaulospora colombiana]|uniref:13746_t:CDS:1 n=1 Tax=Acaulospora colombiana TaxID=27376 RepID=A0ACA9KFM2_9GLOM|nr:13746_t:CDS:1 [Acaulospora colombiana]